MPPIATYDEIDENVNLEFIGFNNAESTTDPTLSNPRSPYGTRLGRRPHSASPRKDAATRGLFDYALLAVLCAIAAMLAFLCVVAAKLATGLSTMDTDAALESYVLHAPPKEVTPLKLSLQCSMQIMHCPHIDLTTTHPFFFKSLFYFNIYTPDLYIYIYIYYY